MNNWWDYLKEDSVSQIQWTPDKGGWVRARLDSITKWEYKKCGCAKHAQSIGERILEEQQERTRG